MTYLVTTMAPGPKTMPVEYMSVADAWFSLVFVKGINAASAISLKDAISLPFLWKVLGILLPRPLLGDGRGSGGDDGFTRFWYLAGHPDGPFGREGLPR